MMIEIEHVQLDEGALNTIMVVSEGDMRKAVTYLQSASELAGKNSIVTSEIVHDVSGQVFSSFLPFFSTLQKLTFYEKLFLDSRPNT